MPTDVLADAFRDLHVAIRKFLPNNVSVLLVYRTNADAARIESELSRVQEEKALNTALSKLTPYERNLVRA